MKRAQKNFERDPRKFFFLRAKPYAMRKQEITNKVHDLIMFSMSFLLRCQLIIACDTVLNIPGDNFMVLF